SIDGFYTGSTFTYASTTSGPFVKAWTHKITEPLALQAIADKSALIKLTANVGKLDEVHFSFIGGSGVVAPEPITMALVGAGMAGLPFAGRFRRFIKRRK
ncbi:MAG: PEP-CTERM sorting domain-containing protein, partial [Nitrospirae bacterium]|nr:PEP-CTERM sorting domain-containing protein [Nitrospirota bacterium]